MEEHDLAPGGQKSWAIALAASAAAVVATVLLVLLVPGLARAGLAALHVAGNLLGLVLFYLFLPIAYLLFLLLYEPLSALLLRFHMPPPKVQSGPNVFEQLRRQQESTSAALGSWLHLLLWLVIGLAALFVLLLVSSGIRRRLDPTRRSSDLRESVWSWDVAGDWLAGLLRRAQPDLATSSLRRWRGEPRSAREMYVELQRRAATLGCARPPEQTAQEHCALLARRLPDVAKLLERLAAGYGAERYGGISAEATLPALLPEWRQIVAACELAGHHGS
jgi:hypothetical protein